jgi:hypothetical protein
MTGQTISYCRTLEQLGTAMGVVYKAEDNVFELQGGGYEALETDFS